MYRSINRTLSTVLENPRSGLCSGLLSGCCSKLWRFDCHDTTVSPDLLFGMQVSDNDVLTLPPTQLTDLLMVLRIGRHLLNTFTADLHSINWRSFGRRSVGSLLWKTGSKIPFRLHLWQLRRLGLPFFCQQISRSCPLLQ